jgi:hypothetical protein
MYCAFVASMFSYVGASPIATLSPATVGAAAADAFAMSTSTRYIVATAAVAGAACGAGVGGAGCVSDICAGLTRRFWQNVLQPWLAVQAKARGNAQTAAALMAR